VNRWAAAAGFATSRFIRHGSARGAVICRSGAGELYRVGGGAVLWWCWDQDLETARTTHHENGRQACGCHQREAKVQSQGGIKLLMARRDVLQPAFVFAGTALGAGIMGFDWSSGLTAAWLYAGDGIFVSTASGRCKPVSRASARLHPRYRGVNLARRLNLGPVADGADCWTGGGSHCPKPEAVVSKRWAPEVRVVHGVEASASELMFCPIDHGVLDVAGRRCCAWERRKPSGAELADWGRRRSAGWRPSETGIGMNLADDCRRSAGRPEC